MLAIAAASANNANLLDAWRGDYSSGVSGCHSSILFPSGS